MARALIGWSGVFCAPGLRRPGVSSVTVTSGRLNATAPAPACPGAPLLPLKRPVRALALARSSSSSPFHSSLLSLLCPPISCSCVLLLLVSVLLCVPVGLSSSSLLFLCYFASNCAVSDRIPLLALYPRPSACIRPTSYLLPLANCIYITIIASTV